MINATKGGNDKYLEIDKKKIDALPDSIEIELEFKEQKNEKSLDIRFGWNSSAAGKKP